MPISPQITNSITGFFSSIAAIQQHVPISSDGNMYELYVYSLLYRALKRNFSLTPQGLNSSREFVFKCSPGPINNAYSYFSFVASGQSYELRNGIEINGHSLEHEVDVCVLMNNAGFNNGHRPDRMDLRIAIECKHYSKASALKGEVRKYLGALSDLSTTGDQFPGRRLPSGCVHFHFHFYRSFATNVPSTQREDLQDFLDSYTLYPKFGLVPQMVQENDLMNQVATYSSTF